MPTVCSPKKFTPIFSRSCSERRPGELVSGPFFTARANWWARRSLSGVYLAADCLFQQRLSIWRAQHIQNRSPQTLRKSLAVQKCVEHAALLHSGSRGLLGRVPAPPAQGPAPPKTRRPSSHPCPRGRWSPPGDTTGTRRSRTPSSPAVPGRASAVPSQTSPPTSGAVPAPPPVRGRLSPRWVRSSSSLCAMVIIDSFLLVHPWKHGVACQHSAAGLPLLFVGHYTSVAEKYERTPAVPVHGGLFFL